MQLLSKTNMQTMVLAMALVVAGTAVAGTGGDTFDSVWITLTDWMQGTLGRILIGLMILTGIGAGVLRQSLMPFVTGVGGGVGLYAAPDVIESIMTATVPAAAAVSEVLLSLPVGL
ncbi:TraA family conjugative transfer protein [Pseudomonas qingdaonensis]|jgi:conjugal transfer pilus assembly protein TraA|uniref:TraA family conjugative transfer protein n=1 Tax=Pseudomonas qingdaonensis TaxID=2056231 RepID=UPI00265DF82E|nr:TraA family conjugative transfer protein [Pseudomonas qingdaonensis]WKL67279.1 TraA family conjugative transfer protein [Pseudomonas qingdaonensis]